MNPVTAGKVKYGAWGLIGGAVIAMIIGFVGGGPPSARPNGWAKRRSWRHGPRFVSPNL
jgi:hypothetical protein